MISRAVLLTGFASLLVAMVVLEVLARVGDAQRATLADVIDAAARRPAGRTVALLGWLWTGWHLFVR